MSIPGSIDLSPAVVVEAPPAPRLLTARGALLLALVVIVQAAVTCWALTAPLKWLPFSGALPVTLLPQTLCGFALGMAALIAPLMRSPREAEERWTLALQRDAFSAGWQGLVLAFSLMICARLVPLETEALFLATVAFGLTALIFALLSRVAEQAYTGIAFAWLIALPMSAYFFVELFQASPMGNQGYAKAMSDTAPTVRSIVHWMLALSPGTLIDGCLTGALVDESTLRARWPLAALCSGTLILGLALRHNLGKNAHIRAKQREVSLTPQS